MPSNYDEVVRKNKQYLTQAQINALAAAAKEYNVQNAGNRAGALSSAREQFDAGFRGLQNMGLAGAQIQQPTSGEVPRLIQQVRTPFDDYNRRLNDVENRRLNALGGLFAQQTQQARVAAAIAQQRLNQQQVERDRAEKLVRINNRNTLPSSPKITVADLTTPSVKEFDEPTPKAAPAELATKSAAESAFNKAGLQLQQTVARAQDIAAAKILGIATPANKAVGQAERALEPITNQKTGAEHTVDDARAAESAQDTFKQVLTNIQNSDSTQELKAAQDAVKRAQTVVDRVKDMRASGSGSNVENQKEFYSDEEKAANQNLAYAKQAEQWAQLKVDDPTTYAFLTVATSDLDPATKRAAGKQFVEQGFNDDKEDAARKYENARISFSRMQNAWEQQNKKEEKKPGVKDVRAAIVEFDQADINSDINRHNKAVSDLKALGFDSIDSAREYLKTGGAPTAETEQPVPENLQKAYDDLIEKEFRYKEPEAYKAAQILQYKDLLKDTNPEVIDWANDAVSDYKLKAMGIKIPGIANEEYTDAKANIKGIREIMDRIESARLAQDSKAKTNTTGDIDYWQQDIDELTKELQTEYGMTVKEAKAFLDEYDADRDARSEYNYYKPGMLALTEHLGETPTQPANTEETDAVYRRVNGLSNITMAASGYEGVESNRVADWMTPKQKDAYNAIYERDGIEAANRYFQDITPFLNIQRAQQDESKYKALADAHPFLADLRSVGANLLWNIPATIERLAIGTANLFSDEQIYYDTKGEMSYRAPRADIIRSQRSQNILNNTNRSDRMNRFLNFAYQSGMSMADSAAAMAVAGVLGNTHAVDALFFSSAGNEAYRDARERGATQDQAMGFAVLSGAAEAIFEHVSVETFADQFLRDNAKARRSALAKLLVQSGTEASEEVTTEIANKLADAWVMDDKSEFNLKVSELMRGGVSKDEAVKRTFMDALKDVSMAGLGGLVSGLGFGLTGAIATKSNEKKTGKAVKENGKLDRLIRAAKLFGGDVAQQAAEVESGKHSDAQVGNLLHELQLAQNEALGIDAESNEQMTETQANELAKKGEALDVVMEGERIAAGDAQKVIDTLGADKLSKMGYDASSADAFAKSYNDNLQKQNIAPMSEIKQAEREFAKGKAAEGLREESFERVYKNPKQGLAYQSEGRTVTPMPGNLTAVSFAEQERSNFKARTTATTGNVTYAFSGMQAREGMNNEQTLAEMQKALTKEARNKADVYQKLASALGIKMTIHDVMTGTNGFIDESGTMHVVLSGRQSVLRVAAHELTHWMKNNNSTGYASLRKHLVNEVGADKFDRMLAQKAREYGIDTSTEKGRAVADDEVCAELCERMLSNEDALEKFAEKDTAAAKSLKDRLLKILNAIKQALKNVKNRDFGESWSDLIREQETIESWIEGLQEAIKNADARAATNEGQIGKVAGVTIADQNNLIEDIKGAKTDAEVDDIIAEHSVDIIEYDMTGYRQDLVESGIMTNEELDDLFDTMKKAVDKVKAHRAILDFGFQLSEEAQNNPELAEKEIAEAKAGRSYLPYKQNADPHYKLALDFSTLCKKRILLQMIQERLQGKLGRALSALETIAVRREIQKLQKNGVDVEVACALCYVEAARLKSPKVINEFLGVDLSESDRTNNVEAEMKNYFAQKDKDIKKDIEKAQKQWKVEKLGADWRGQDKKGRTITAEKATKDQLKAFGGQALVDDFNKYSKDLRTGNLVSDALKKDQQAVIDEAKRLVRESPETFLSADSLAKLKKSNPDIFYAFTNKVRSATRSKALETDTFYSRGDISMVEEAIIRTANQESGFRHQSWSDFMPIHLLDTMASVIEMSQRGAKMHAYTKVPEMVRLLGNTGMMLNLSLIPTGQTGLVDGRLDFDSTEGMDYDTMLELRNMFPNTVGNIAIGISDDQIKMLLQSDDIDYVIPYHVSGLNKQLRTHMGIHTWLDFTSTQNESERDGKAPSGRTWKEEHKARKMKPPALAAWFSEKEAKDAGSNGIEYMQQAAQKYLDICARDGWVPKFSQYLDYDEKANKYTPKAGYENYWKTLTDRKMVNQKTGEVIIQQAVKPKFDQDTVMDILNGEAENPTAIRNAAAADEIANELGKTWRADKENANLKAYKDELNAFREASAVMAADRVKEDVKRRLEESRFSLDTDELRETFTHIDTEALDNGLESLRNVTPGKGLWAIKDISRFLDSVAGGDKALRDNLTKIFETPHRQSLKNYATGVSDMQKKVLEIGAKAGVCDSKGHHFDKKKSAAIQNIGEGFSNRHTYVSVRMVDADAVRVTATDKETGKALGTKDYTFRELRGAYGREVADQLWSEAFDAAQEAGNPVDVEREVNTQPYTLEDLKEAYPQDWQKLKTAADEFRTMYDEYIRDINGMLETIYPNASKYATVDKITEAIEKKQQRLADRKAAYNIQIENLQKSLEAKEQEIASKKRTDTKAFRDLVDQANQIQSKIAAAQAEIAEYEANVKDELTVMGEEKALMMNAEREGDSLGRMHRLEYRSDYFHHFTEMTSGIQSLKAIFTGNTDISPAVVGKSDQTKPKSRFAGFFQKRQGGDYTADALNGMLRYGQLAEYKLAFDPFAAYLRDVEKQVANLDKNATNRDNLIRYIQQWTNTILGKSHTIDRALVDSGIGMRSKLFKALSWINSRVIQNTLLWNMRSALIQISNVTNAKGIVTNNLDWANGLRKWALAARGNSEMQSIMNQSTFLASRYMDNLQLTDSVMKSAKEFAGWLLGALDEVSAKATWWAAYTQYQRNPNAKVIQNAYRTYDNAIDYADDVTRRTHAGRGVGELAPAMTSRVINLVAPFQVEVNNTYQLLKDNVKQKNYLGLLSTGLSVFALNTIFEAIVGSTPLGFDIIRAIVDIAFGIAGDDPDDDKDDYDVKRVAQRLAGEFVGGLPYANQIVGLIGKDNAEKILGSDTDVTRYGNTQIGLNAMMNTIAGISDIGNAVKEGKNLFTETNFISDIDDLLNIIMPMGAKQMTRTAEGLMTVAKGYGSKADKEGNEKVQFVADQDLVNWLHAGLFGKWALTQASEYFNEERLLPKLFGAYEGPKSATGQMVDAKEYKAALETGIDGKQFFSLKYDMKGYTTQGGKRAEIMQQDFTPEQKAKLDALLVPSKDAEVKTEGAAVYQKSGDEWKVKADYTNQAWLDVSMLGQSHYEKAKAGAKLSITPEAYLAAYNKDKEIDGAKLGSQKQSAVIKYLDGLNLSAPAYDYLLLAVFGYKSR